MITCGTGVVVFSTDAWSPRRSGKVASAATDLSVISQWERRRS